MTTSRRAKTRHVNLCCSFCGKGQRQVKKLIAGPTVYICDECVELCNDIIAAEGASPSPEPRRARSVEEAEAESRHLDLLRSAISAHFIATRLALMDGVPGKMITAAVRLADRLASLAAEAAPATEAGKGG